jgi:hypothetical protein
VFLTESGHSLSGVIVTIDGLAYFHIGGSLVRQDAAA